MHYRSVEKHDKADIQGLSRDELGWTFSDLYLEEILGNYPGAAAINRQGLCGFACSRPVSSDILQISSLLVAHDHRHEGIGDHLLGMLEDQAYQAGYEALVFLEDPNWFEEKSLSWIEQEGYRSVYDTDQSRLVVKEVM